MKNLFFLLLMTVSFISYGQTITGQWETFDEETNEKKALIEIYKTNDTYFAKIVNSYKSDADKVCDNCKGSKKGQKIRGLVIIEDIKKDGDEYNDGTILDPENGKVYKCYLELEEPNKLKVRGYLGFSLLGRTQYWIRKQ